MTFTRVNPLGWALFEVLTSAQMNQLDIDHADAIDGAGGGVYSPTATIELDMAADVTAIVLGGSDLAQPVAPAPGQLITGRRNVHVTGSGAGALGVTGGNSTGSGSAGIGIGATGGLAEGTGQGGIGALATGGDAAGVGDAGSGAETFGGATAGGVGGAGLRALGGVGASGGAGVLGFGAGGGAGGSFAGSGGAGGVVGFGTIAAPGVSGIGGSTDGPGGLFLGGVADGEGVTYRETFDGGTPRALLNDLAPPSASVDVQAPVKRKGITELPARERAREVGRIVTDAVRSTLGLTAGDAVDPGQGFFDIGLDSLMAVTLAESLEDSLDLTLASAVVFDHPTVDRLTAHLLESLGGSTVAEQIVLSERVDEPIAIVGMACRFPGAEDVEAFWKLLVEGRCAIGEAPRERWPELDALFDARPGTPGRTYTTEGGFLDDIAMFDPSFFGISPREAAAMDPQQRLLLELSWEALERGSITPDALGDSRTGVYVGMGASEYDARFVGRPADVLDAYSGTGNDTSFAAGRISYVLGLHGPALTVNTACSASLVSVHLACEALRSGACDRAIAGGVNLMVASDSTVRLAQLRALSPTVGVVLSMPMRTATCAVRAGRCSCCPGSRMLVRRVRRSGRSFEDRL